MYHNILKQYYFLLFFCLNVHVSAQFYDDFSDTDLTDNPEWLGDLDYFSVTEEGELWMNYPNDESGTAYIYTETQIPDSIEWNFYFRLEFAPSASNQLTIYLQLDDPDPTLANGYAISLGESGQDDALRIIRLINGEEEEIARVADGEFGTSPASATIRVTRNLLDDWNLYLKLSGEPFFIPILNFHDDEITSSDLSYFGILCEFTKSNRDRFFFDNIGVSSLTPDNVGPNITSIEFLEFNRINVLFDEPLLPNSITPSTFNLKPGNTTPISAMIQGFHGNEVLLDFDDPFSNGIEYILECFNILDELGNTADSEFSFQFILPEEPAWKDLIISEIGAAPNSGTPLPNEEYFEIYNRSEKYISLEDCMVRSGSSTQLLPPEIISPGDYYIICDDSNQESFQQYGQVMALSSFPSLSNGGDDIIITNPSDSLIDIVVYNDSWHDNEDLADIGHSLELIDFENICAIAENWRTSIDNKGGTPGQYNSVLGQLQPTIPKIIKLFPHSNTSLVIEFDQRVDLSNELEKFQVLPGNHIIEEIIQSNLQGTSWLIFLNNPIDSGLVYTLSLLDFQDCSHTADGIVVTQRFGLPKAAGKEDIIFNEVLYDPHINGSEYLEFYCKGESILDASKLYLRVHSSTGSITSIVLGDEKLVFPGDYITITKDPAGVLDFYSVLNQENLWISELPALTSEGTAISLWSDNGSGLIKIDSFQYSPTMHSPLLSETKGVSLERISPNGSSIDHTNWFSASPNSGGGTPNAINSQNNILESQIQESPFNIQVETFSPDGDGFDDRMIISYLFEEGDHVISSTIYNLDAHLIKRLMDIPVTGSNGFIYWDGLMEDGRVAPAGVYIIHIETYSPKGNTKDFRYSVILATKE